MVLPQPDLDRRFYLECDASDFAIGAVLHQRDDHGRSRPLGFFSRKLQHEEANYEIYDKELLAIHDGLQHWRSLLIGTDLPVTIFSDHRNLEYLMSSRQLNRRQARWSLFFADFNFTIVYRKGSEQMVADPCPVKFNTLLAQATLHKPATYKQCCHPLVLVT